MQSVGEMEIHISTLTKRVASELFQHQKTKKVLSDGRAAANVASKTSI